MSEWTVTLFPEEKAFIDEVFRRTLESENGMGRMIVPVRGGVIQVDDDYRGMTEEQKQWLVFNRLQDDRYRHTNFQGMKFMNFTYNEAVPEVLDDPEAMDKWGVKRMTTAGQPVNETTGWPLEYVQHEETMVRRYEWSADNQGFIKVSEDRVHNAYKHDGFPVPEKVVE
jgi:hypothetical protein